MKNGRSRRKKEITALTNWQQANPEKVIAQGKVRYQVKIGNILKPSVCEICKSDFKLLAHHDDYQFPLKVRWLCYSCHKLLHNNLTRKFTGAKIKSNGIPTSI